MTRARAQADGTLAIDALFNAPSNVGKVRAAGIDLSLAAQTPKAGWGRLSANLDVAYLTRWEAATPEVAGGAYRSALGQYNDVVPVNPNAGLSNATRGLNYRWRHTASIAWQNDSWKLQLSQRYQSKVRDQNLPALVSAAGSEGARDVKAYEQYNLTTT